MELEVQAGFRRLSAVAAIIAPVERGLHYEACGAGDTLLLVHGTGSSLRVWDPVVDMLAASRTVISVDLPGFGSSAPLGPRGPRPPQRASRASSRASCATSATTPRT